MEEQSRIERERACDSLGGFSGCCDSCLFSQRIKQGIQPHIRMQWNGLDELRIFRV